MRNSEKLNRTPLKRLATRITEFCTVATVISFLTGCAVGTPFKGPGFESGSVVTETENDMVVVGLTYIQTGDDAEQNRVFWQHVGKVHDAIEQQPGLIGYSIRREILGDQGWTMTVWKDERSLNQFVGSQVHRDAMQNGLPALQKTGFARLVLHKDRIPLSWKEAEKILETQGRQYSY